MWMRGEKPFTGKAGTGYQDVADVDPIDIALALAAAWTPCDPPAPAKPAEKPLR